MLKRIFLSIFCYLLLFENVLCTNFQNQPDQVVPESNTNDDDFSSDTELINILQDVDDSDESILKPRRSHKRQPTNDQMVPNSPQSQRDLPRISRIDDSRTNYQKKNLNMPVRRVVKNSRRSSTGIRSFPNRLAHFIAIALLFFICSI